MTNLPDSIPTNGANETPNGFFLAHLNPADSGVDTVYLTDDTGGDIEKYSLDADGVSWDLDGEIFAQNVRGLTGVVSGSGPTAIVTLYATTSGTDGESGTLYKYVDSSGFGGSVGERPVRLPRPSATKRSAAWRWFRKRSPPRTSSFRLRRASRPAARSASPSRPKTITATR